MITNESERMASALAGVAAAICCSLVWLSGGLVILATQNGVA